jgi:hypothetical protein
MPAATDRANEEFWNEICRSGLARQLGITEHTKEALERFDCVYLELHLYLLHRVPTSEMSGKAMEACPGHRTLEKLREMLGKYSHVGFFEDNIDGLIAPKLHLTWIPRKRPLSSVATGLGTDIHPETQK